MFFDILKRDLKRKKTMNLILLLFMLLSVTFVSSSVNTVISVMSATDKFLDVSGAKDYFVATIGTQAQQELDEKIGEVEEIIFQLDADIEENLALLEKTKSELAIWSKKMAESI